MQFRLVVTVFFNLKSASIMIGVKKLAPLSIDIYHNNSDS